MYKRRSLAQLLRKGLKYPGPGQALFVSRKKNLRIFFDLSGHLQKFMALRISNFFARPGKKLPVSECQYLAAKNILDKFLLPMFPKIILGRENLALLVFKFLKLPVQLFISGRFDIPTILKISFLIQISFKYDKIRNDSIHLSLKITSYF